ncbi:hypothetical protein TNCV_3021801 [Trichonephila clavipes]|nr:hypothetical protein TNCV_3021801 [Trichonephila clavipes]
MVTIHAEITAEQAGLVSNQAKPVESINFSCNYGCSGLRTWSINRDVANPVWWLVTLTAVPEGLGSNPGVAGSSRDVTEDPPLRRADAKSDLTMSTCHS